MIPVPMVLPPSRSVKLQTSGQTLAAYDICVCTYREPTSPATSLWRVQTISTLSPGMTIFSSASAVPSGHDNRVLMSAVRMKS